VLESKKSKEINLYSDYTKNKLQVLAFAVITYVLIAEIWLTMFTMDFLINQGIVPFLYSFVLAKKKAIPFKKWQLLTWVLRHCKLASITHVSFAVQTRNKDFLTLHE